MHVTPPLPLPKRVPSGAWTALARWAGLVSTFLVRIRLPAKHGLTLLPRNEAAPRDAGVSVRLRLGTPGVGAGGAGAVAAADGAPMAAAVA
ncbi:hypothetical protein GCM10022419_094170 [Nonomuraea rosea]|uniref:Uncharacterized protein n=1 Tax=Nonomuraea rosea TaxID=638574 RepID=A0ABP6Z254_9ACTN